MKFSGGINQVLLSIGFTLIVILGFYLFKYVYFIPKYSTQGSFWFSIALSYFVSSFIYLLVALLVNTFFVIVFRKLKFELISLSFASSYLLIVLSSVVIGFIEYYNFPFLLLSIIAK
ncbi:MAG: hypothetical protein COA32_06945 [Fluviicola sp.]|nr:MAG: hypothetical protein COA32_06945 [Fluviicola sp.]